MLAIGSVDINRLSTVVKEKFGYGFQDYALSSIERRLIRLMELKKIPDVDTLIFAIERGMLSKEVFLNEITVNVTELFRDPSFWRALKTLMGGLSVQKKRITIWHHGCSTGEEVFSMLILLDELDLIDKVDIIACDIDTMVLAKAKAGKIYLRNMPKYEANYLSYNPNGVIRNYFIEDNEYAYFDKELLSRVVFKEYFLGDTIGPMDADLILCRNVMIYFNQEMQNDIVKLFYNNLNEKGYLALGAKESVVWSDCAAKFYPVTKEEKIFQKI